MNRRNWLKAAGGIGASFTFAGNNALPALAFEGGSPCSFETSIVRLKLQHTWTTTMSSSEYRDTLHLRLTSDGVTGIGEGAPIVRYHEDAIGAQKAVERSEERRVGKECRSRWWR